MMSKNGLTRKLRLISKPTTSETGKKFLQYTNCPIRREVKKIRQLHLDRQQNIMREIFLAKNYNQNMFLKNSHRLFSKNPN